MSLTDRIIEPYFSERTPEGFEAYFLPAILAGYSWIAFYNPEYLFNLSIIDKLIQSFLVGFAFVMFLRSVIIETWTGEIYSVETDRHTIQISIIISVLLTAINLLRYHPL